MVLLIRAGLLLFIYFATLVQNFALATSNPLCPVTAQQLMRARETKDLADRNAVPSTKKLSPVNQELRDTGMSDAEIEKFIAYQATKGYLENKPLYEAILQTFEGLGARSKAELKDMWITFMHDNVVDGPEITSLVAAIKTQLMTIIPRRELNKLKAATDVRKSIGMSPKSFHDLQDLLYIEGNRQLCDDAIKYILLYSGNDLINNVSGNLPFTREARNYLYSFFGRQPIPLIKTGAGAVAAAVVVKAADETTDGSNDSSELSLEQNKKHQRTQREEDEEEEEDPLGAIFVKINAGDFMMGVEGRKKKPVKIADDFHLQTTPVTQKQWYKIMGTTPSSYNDRKDCPESYEIVSVSFWGTKYICPDLPVDYVSHTDALKFIKKLNSMQTKYTYDLPSSEQWEYAARAGTDTKFHWGDGYNEINNFAWTTDDVSSCQLHPVGQKMPNPYGLYDLFGGVTEWTKTVVPNHFDMRFTRGGSCGSSATNWGSGAEHSDYAGGRRKHKGFRLVRTPR